MNDQAKPRFFYGYIIMAAGFCIWFIGWGGHATAFGVFFKPLLNEFGWSRADTSLAYSLAFLVQASMGIAVGSLTDRLGPRFVIMVFGSFLGVAYLLLSRITSLWQFQLIYSLAVGIGASTLTIPIMVTMGRWFVSKRGLMMGIVQSGISFGGLLFPPFAGWLILNQGWRSAYVVLGIITLAGIILSGLLLKRDPQDVGQKPDGTDSAETQGRDPKEQKKKDTGLLFREAVRTRQFWMIAGLLFSFGFCRSTYRPHIVVFVQDLGFTLADGANILALTAATSLLGRIGLGRLADKIGNRQTFAISFAATTIALFCGLAAGDLTVLYLFALFYGLGWGGQAVLRFTLTPEIFGFLSLGLIVGVLGFVEAGAATIGSYFAGLAVLIRPITEKE
ncbi:MAG: MFS transporter [Deltaproteobacteria bacterium]|nr:MFS transporter [Deltaproteobacteria bacterium]